MSDTVRKLFDVLFSRRLAAAPLLPFSRRHILIISDFIKRQTQNFSCFFTTFSFHKTLAQGAFLHRREGVVVITIVFFGLWVGFIGNWAVKDPNSQEYDPVN